MSLIGLAMTLLRALLENICMMLRFYMAVQLGEPEAAVLLYILIITLNIKLLGQVTVNKLSRFFFINFVLIFVFATINSKQLNAQSKLMNSKKQYDLSEIDTIQTFFKIFKQHIRPYKNTIDTNPLPSPYKITGILSDSINEFFICSIPVTAIFVNENGNERSIYLLIENREEFIQKIIRGLEKYPYSLISSGHEGAGSYSINAYCFEKKNYEVWLDLGSSFFLGQNKRSHALITLLNGNFQLINN